MFLLFIVSYGILFLGVADDPKVVGKLKCNTWFQLHTEAKTVTLSGNRLAFEVKYFLKYLCYISIIIFQFFLISRLIYVHHYRLISFGDKLWRCMV